MLLLKVLSQKWETNKMRFANENFKRNWVTFALHLRLRFSVTLRKLT